MFALRSAGVACAGLLILLAACESNNAPINFQVACPQGALDVNAPISLVFTARVSTTSISTASIVVTDSTGLVVAGSLRISGDGLTVQFIPSEPLPFGAQLRLRVQNVLAQGNNTPIPLTVCALLTVPPPLQLVWDALPQPAGGSLVGVTLSAPDSGYVAYRPNPLFSGGPLGFQVIFNLPFFSQTFDVAFANLAHGFGAHFDTRRLRGVISQTINGGQTFDTLFSIGGRTIQRLFTNRVAQPSDTLFLVGGAGTGAVATFLKYTPASRTVTIQEFAGNTGAVADIDFAATDTVNGAAVTNGQTFLPGVLGRVYASVNGGRTWTERAGLATPPNVVTYLGVARRASGDVFVVGGNGYAIRVSPAGTVDTILKGAVSSLDSSRFQALLYTDVEFSPDNDQKGWIVGARQTGVVAGVPQFEGLIFQTTDGGTTWTRQGVRGVPNNGGQFPRLNRLSVLDQSHVWIVGDGGTVLSYRP